MPFTRGKIKFENIDAGTEQGRKVVMFELDCLPKPMGSERNMQYTTEALPFFLPRFLQPHELPSLLEGAKQPGETLTAEALLDSLKQPFAFSALTIDINNLPAGWKQTESCFWVTVGYIVTYRVLEIRAVATEDFTASQINWPKDETVANFRILAPLSYVFHRSFTWNPECCTEEARTRADETSASYPRPYYIDINPDKYKFGDDMWKPFNPYNPWGGHKPGW